MTRTTSQSLFPVGGTSLSVPCWAGLIAIADQGRVAAGGTTLDGPSQTLPALYSLPSSDFHDITSGPNGDEATPGYDMLTGLGGPNADLLVSDLAAYQMPPQFGGHHLSNTDQVGGHLSTALQRHRRQPVRLDRRR